METVQQSLIITEEQIIEPTIEVLKEVTPFPNYQNHDISPSLNKSLDILFPEQLYDEKDIQKAKEILGPIAENFTSEQLRDAVTEIQFLVEGWLDEFERRIFNGVTLKELLHEKGGL